MDDCFCLDTSFFINGWRKNYRYDVFPAVWEFIDVLMNNGRVAACREVYDELLEQKDDLSAWAKRRKMYFADPDAATQAELTKLMAEHPNFAAQGGTRGKADPWVIAHAVSIGGIVVTDEIQSKHKPKPTKPPKIPDICEHRKIKWLSPIDFLAAINFKAITPEASDAT